MARMSRVVLMVAAAALVTACGSVEPIEPVSMPTRPTTPPPSTTPSSVTPPTAPGTYPTPSTRPARPKDIDLTMVQDCSSVANLPVTRWKVGAGRPFVNADGSATFPDSLICLWGQQKTAYGLLLEFVTNVDAFKYEYLDRIPHTQVQVKGYPVIVLSPTQFKDRCEGLIDVHDGHLVSVSYWTNPSKPAATQATLCTQLPAIAAATLTALGA